MNPWDGTKKWLKIVKIIKVSYIGIYLQKFFQNALSFQAAELSYGLVNRLRVVRRHTLYFVLSSSFSQAQQNINPGRGVWTSQNARGWGWRKRLYTDYVYVGSSAFLHDLLACNVRILLRNRQRSSLGSETCCTCISCIHCTIFPRDFLDCQARPPRARDFDLPGKNPAAIKY